MNVLLCSNSILSPNLLTSIDAFERKAKSKGSKSNIVSFCMLFIFNVAPVHRVPKDHWASSIISEVSQVTK